MTMLDRRHVLGGLSAALCLTAAPSALLAQQPQNPNPPPPPQTPPQPRFGFEDVQRRAREVAAVAYEPPEIPLQQPVYK